MSIRVEQEKQPLFCQMHFPISSYESHVRKSRHELSQAAQPFMFTYSTGAKL